MICALLIGREGSSGFPGKNLLNVLGRPLCSYPMIAAKESKYIDRIYVSSDSEKIKEIALQYDCNVIDRPDYLCTKEALGEDAFEHGYQVISEELAKDNQQLDYLVLLMCNAPTISAELIDKGVEMLNEDSDADSAVTVSVYNMWSPLRARKLNDSGYLDPMVPFSVFGDENNINCDRDSQGDVYYADMGCSIVRPRCIENMEEGLLPQKWMGQKILPIRNWGGLDMDYSWQIGMVEFWLREHGVKYSQMRRD